AEGTTGNDVRQLESNLAALGYDGFTVDTAFSAATTAAVKRWQKALGRPETGTVEVADVVYTTEAVRGAQLLLRVGARTPGDVASSPAPRGVVPGGATAAEAAWAAAGTKVRVPLPGETEVRGVVTTAVPASPSGQSGADGPSAVSQIVVTIGIED